MDSADAITVVNNIVSDSALDLQAGFNEDGLGLFVVKNTAIVNTSVRLASKTVKYHEISEQKINNCKKFAHICFWLVKLQPLSVVPTKDVYQIGLSNIKNMMKGNFPEVVQNKFFQQLEEKVLDIPDKTPDGYSHLINEQTSLNCFCTLVCRSEFGDESPKKIAKFFNSKMAAETLKSLKFHNYSARTMAMYCESMLMEKIFEL